MTHELGKELHGPDVTGTFEVLYERADPDIDRYVLGLTRSRDDADDVTAETFERAYAATLAGRGPGDRPVPWLLAGSRPQSSIA